MIKYRVSVVQQETASYSENPPYNPPVLYPELNNYFPDVKLDKTNTVYDCVRETFRLLDYDSDNYSKNNWNPLGWIINPGEIVMLNPNMLTHKHQLNDDWDYVITHGSVIRAVVDYTYLALKGKGRIIIADGPQDDSIIEKILERLGIPEIQKFYKQYLNFDIEFIDFRSEKLINIDGVTGKSITLEGDPEGNVVFDLAENSMLSEFDNRNIKFYGCAYDLSETQSHHTNGKHEYCICKTPLLADVFINIPKLKSHKKCGLTVNLKSLVGGVNANKNYLPHYIIGSPETGGDQFDTKTIKTTVEKKLVLFIKKFLANNNKLVQFLSRKFKKQAYKIFGETTQVVRSGNWYGNDTVWRMCLDLNRILMYGNPDGTLDSGKKKKFLSVVDGINSMEGNGPNSGTLKKTSLIITGDNAVSVDLVCARLMGFDENKIKLISKSLEKNQFPLFQGILNDVNVLSNKIRWNKKAVEITLSDSLKFKPHFGWKDHIELIN